MVFCTNCGKLEEKFIIQHGVQVLVCLILWYTLVVGIDINLPVCSEQFIIQHGVQVLVCLILRNTVVVGIDINLPVCSEP